MRGETMPGKLVEKQWNVIQKVQSDTAKNSQMIGYIEDKIMTEYKS